MYDGECGFSWLKLKESRTVRCKATIISRILNLKHCASEDACVEIRKEKKKDGIPFRGPSLTLRSTVEKRLHCSKVEKTSPFLIHLGISIFVPNTLSASGRSFSSKLSKNDLPTSV